MVRVPRKLSVGFLFDDTLDSNDGVAQYVKTLGSWLTAQGHKVSYLVGETKASEWAGGTVYSLAKNQTVYFNGNKLSMPLLSRKRQIDKALQVGEFDVLHVMVPYSPLMSQRVINAAARSTAIVGTFHIFPSGFLSRGGSHILRLIYGRSLRKILSMTSVSRPAADFAKQVYKLNSIVVPNPVDISRLALAHQHHHPAASMKIVFLGRLAKRKGCQQLIEAFEILSQRLPEAHLTIAGDGSQRQRLEKMVRDRGMSDRVDFLGYISEESKPELLGSADVACFPSLYGESFGIVLVEAMAAGSGVVLAGNNPGYSSVLGAQPELLLNPRDKQSFADRLYKLLTDHDLRQKLHRWQEAEVKQYDIGVVGKQILSVYEGAIAKRLQKRHN